MGWVIVLLMLMVFFFLFAGKGEWARGRGHTGDEGVLPEGGSVTSSGGSQFKDNGEASLATGYTHTHERDWLGVSHVPVYRTWENTDAPPAKSD